MSSCSPPPAVVRVGVVCFVPKRTSRKAAPRVRLSTPQGAVRIPLSKRLELAGLDVAGHARVDLVLAGVRVQPAQLPGAQPAPLEDLQHVDEVDAGGDGEG